MADPMTYGDLKALLGAWLVRADLAMRAAEFIALAEARLRRRLGVDCRLSDDRPTNDLLANNPDAYLFAALSEAGPLLDDAELAKAYEARFERAVREIRAVERV